MASRYWMITNRRLEGSGDTATLGKKDAGALRFFTAPPDAGDLTKLSAWQALDRRKFRKELADAASTFPDVAEGNNEAQQHVTIYIHGYNNTWEGAVGRYQKIVNELYTGAGGLGECIFFTWPSNGEKAAYLADRLDARRSADDLAGVLAELYDWLVGKQASCAAGGDPCRAKTSIIAHSMGAYLVEEALYHVWNGKNRPLLVSLINQLLLVAADVDNDLFGSGEAIGGSPGEGIANLSYRVTALYTGLDSVLGASAGLKHFGKRRLGRSGLDRNKPLPDNVWDVDISSLFDVTKDHGSYHSAAFEEPKCLQLMQQVLRGVDRRILVARGVASKAEGMAVTTVANEGTTPTPKPRRSRSIRAYVDAGRNRGRGMFHGAPLRRMKTGLGPTVRR